MRRGWQRGAVIFAHSVRCQVTNFHLSDCQSEMKTWKVPTRDSAKNLYSGYEKFLKGQEDIINQSGKMISILEDKALGNDEKGKQIEKIALAIAPTEKAQLAELNNLQRAFATDYNMTLK